MPSPLSRRTFLAAGASAVLLAACGDDSDKTTSSGTSASSSGAEPAFVLGKFFPDDALTATGPQRMPMALFNADGSLADELPAQLTFTIEKDGAPVGTSTPVSVHREGLQRGYYPVIVEATGPGVYKLRSEVQGTPVDASVQLATASAVKQPGQPLTPVETPTTDNLRGIELLCTHKPDPCPLHDVTLTQALASGQHVAFLIATPQFCQTAICGPVLDILLGVTSQFPQVKFLHSEVYPSVAAAQGSNPTLVDAVKAQGLTYEPCLFLTGTDGVISQRLDTIFDTTELKDALSKLGN